MASLAPRSDTRKRSPPRKAVGSELAALGTTPVTDVTPDLDAAGIASIAKAMSKGDLPQRVQLLDAR
ncbi:hypothetical protein [Rhodococcus sp. 27YEA15]|uniref:hypothetical protein n=1 Tax=Rhodococcus sp. 27YEA15 TaxID=3156259 RepID=UPI003C7989A4